MIQVAPGQGSILLDPARQFEIAIEYGIAFARVVNVSGGACNGVIWKIAIGC